MMNFKDLSNLDEGAGPLNPNFGNTLKLFHLELLIWWPA